MSSKDVTTREKSVSQLALQGPSPFLPTEMARVGGVGNEVKNEVTPHKTY